MDANDRADELDRQRTLTDDNDSSFGSFEQGREFGDGGVDPAAVDRGTFERSHDRKVAERGHAVTEPLDLSPRAKSLRDGEDQHDRQSNQARPPDERVRRHGYAALDSLFFGLASPPLAGVAGAGADSEAAAGLASDPAAGFVSAPDDVAEPEPSGADFLRESFT